MRSHRCPRCGGETDTGFRCYGCPVIVEGEPYSASRLQELLNGRDDFIVRKGLWTEFTDELRANSTKAPIERTEQT